MFDAALWFVFGLGLGLILIAFVALGSYARGYESARREPFRAELVARRSAAEAGRKSQALAPKRAVA